MIRYAWILRNALVLFLLVAAVAAASQTASAQGTAQSIDKFVLPPEAAKKALTRSEISADTAAKITQVCLDYAAKNNLAVSVFVLNPSGNVVHAHRMDGLTPIQIDTGLYKAQTALYMRTSTHAAADRFDMAGQVTRVKLNQYWVSGGLPIIVDDQLIGTIGVGGSNKDEECAYAGLVAVLGPQPPLTVTKPRTPAPDQVPPQR